MLQERNIEGVGDGMVEGGAALGMGIYRGFTGLVTKPVEGAKSKGVGGFLKGVGKGFVGAIAQPISGGLDFASSAFEGIDATKDQLIGRPRAGTANRRLRLPRAIGGDGKVTAFIGSDGTEKEVRQPAYSSKSVDEGQVFSIAFVSEASSVCCTTAFLVHPLEAVSLHLDGQGQGSCKPL